MRILIANHHLVSFGGTEAFTLELAKGLKRKGHDVTVYSKFIDKLAPFLDREEIPYVSDLSLLHKRFDIAHVHHNISAMEIRAAFPTLPIFYLSHGALHFLEQPPKLDVNISLYGAVSPHIKDKLVESGIAAKNVVVVPNVFDERRFLPKRPLNAIPKRVLLLSAKIDPLKEKIVRKACAQLALKLDCVGGRFGEVGYYGIPREINKADIVIGIGRGIIEAMLCGRVPIVFDVFGGDGMVTPQNFEKLRSRNFTGKVSARQYTAAALVKEMKKYDVRLGDELKQLAYRAYSLDKQVKTYEDLYTKTIALYQRKPIDHVLLSNYVDTIHASVFYQARMKPYQLKRDYNEFRRQLNEITDSKLFKLWPLYVRIKNIIKLS